MNAPVTIKLSLEDGTEQLGRAFGTGVARWREVVFNTGMTGYVEALTDP
jgi:carbamoyl-phosphate synthase small subunit